MNIFDLDSWNEIWETINRNRKRSIMTAFGVFWGIFMLIMLIGLGLGLERGIRSALGGVAVNSAVFMTGRTSVPYKGFAAGRWWKYDQSDLDRIRRMDDVKYATGFMWGFSPHFVYGNNKGDYRVMGMEPEYIHINPMTITEGRFINDIDMSQQRKVCVIAKFIADELMPGEDPLGKSILMGNTYMTVIGVFEKSRNGINFSDPERTVYIPRSTYHQMRNFEDGIDVIALNGTDRADMNTLVENIEVMTRENHSIAPADGRAFEAVNLADQYRIFSGVFSGVRILTWIVGIGTLLAGIVGISNIMLIVVRERTQEIGVRRALGARPSAIISQIMAESFVLTFIAGIFGMALAIAILSIPESAGMQMMEGTFDTQISLGLALGSLGILILGGLLAGLLPSSRAISIKPVDAIREE